VRIILYTSLFLSTSFDFESQMEFKPERISKCSTIELHGPATKVFPLFGPVLEKQWAEGWDPEIIYPTTGVVGKHMIFQTKAHHQTENVFTWVVTDCQPEKYFIEYTVSTAQRIWFIHVQCEAVQSKTITRICYTYTGFTTLGNAINQTAIKKIFANNLKDWEEAINYYLKNGRQLSGNN
jgi:hypothetical protein